MDLLCSVYDTNDNRSIDMTDKVKQVIWVYDKELKVKKRINLQTLLKRANSPYNINRFKYFALEKDRDEFAKECRS